MQRTKQRSSTTTGLVLGAALGVCMCCAAPAHAFGFGLGAELGGHGSLPVGGLAGQEAGGELALLADLQFLTIKDLVKLHGLLRVEGGGGGVFGDGFGGFGGGGGAELLFRTGLGFPVVEPFFELGGGALGGAGGGTADVGSVAGAADSAVSTTFLIPGGYAGLGLTLTLPFLPYFELRGGVHGGYLMPFPGQKLGVTVDNPLVLRGEGHLGAGFRF